MKYLGYFVVALVLAVVAYGLYLVGSPNAARLQNLDNQRISDLQNVQYQIIYYWQAKQKLPANLSDLVDPTRGVFVPVDPENRSAYGYNAIGPLEFSLCANFSKDSNNQSDSYPLTKAVPPTPIGIPYPAESNWSHGVGNVCFDRKIDTAFYPPIK